LPEKPVQRTCPICGARFEWTATPFRPFCSDRCKLVDLGAWAAGRYAIPGERIDRERGEGEEDETAGEKEEGPPPGDGSSRSRPQGGG